jgi:transglycosylase-like protein with SLT domain
MSSMGINPLAIYDPETYAKQIAIQRRQALAQGLLEQGSGNAGSAPYGGLANAGKEVLGAFLAKRADQQLGNLYSPQQPQQGVTDPGQVTNMPSQPQGPSPGPAPGATTPTAGYSSPPAQAHPQPSQQPDSGDNPPDYANLPPQAKAIYDRIPHIPGMPAMQALNFFMTNPSGYQAAWAKNYEQTDLQKNTGAAFSPGSPQYQQMLAGTLQKGAVVNLRPGGGALDYSTGNITTMPNQAGIQTLFPQGMNGQAQMQMAPGAASALAQSTAASGYGKAATTPAVGYDGNSQPVATNQAQMLGQSPLIPGINPGATQAVESRGNPMAVSPAGAAGPMQTMPGTLSQPGFGVTPAQNGTSQEQGRVGADYQQAMMQKYQNPVLATIAYNWGPGNTDKWLASGGDFAKLPPETQQYLGRMAVAQALPQRGSQNAPQPSQPNQSLRPELPQGQATYMQGQAKDAADRHDATVAAASESPMRINVLDNIIKLSQAGVQTGPGSEWQNTVKGYLANTPGLGKMLGSTQDNVGNFQELQKFMYQNALRNWQAAGGTGTDSQLESAAKANPNDHLFPQALQTIAKWGKASELAVQGKANAQDRFLAQSGNSPTAQINFESTWRNSFDPKVFQYQLMSPQEKQAFASTQLKTPQAAKAFLAKQQSLQQLGAIQ